VPLRGMLSPKAPPNCTSEDLAFAESYREVYARLPKSSLQAYAKRLNMDKATLSRHLHGSRRPSPDTVTGLYEIARAYQQGVGGHMPLPLTELLRLLAAAAASRSGHRSVAPVPRNASAGAAATPPVPSESGAGRQTEDQEWHGADTVEELHRAGQLQAVHVLLSETGRSAAPETVCAAASALRRRGLNDAADTLLRAAGHRSDADRTAILAILNRAHRSEDIGAVLSAALYLLGAVN